MTIILYGLDTYKYNEDSIRHALFFINNVRERIGSNSRVFIAFQANVICDTTHLSSSFRMQFEGMKSYLIQNGVHIANLRTNLRNTKTIGEVTRNVKVFTSIAANFTMTQHIQALSVKTTDVKSFKPPLLIPIHFKQRKKHLTPSLKRALERAKQSNQNIVIMYDNLFKSVTSEEIKKSLVECGEEKHDILIHPNKFKNECPTPLINYLKQPKGIYVVPFKSFVGMEANSVICIISENKYTYASTSIRCNLSRAVSQLTIILESTDDTLSNTGENRVLFQSVEVDPTFIECSKIMKFEAFKCNSCHRGSSSTSSQLLDHQQQSQESWSSFMRLFKHEKYVCHSCIHVCHNNHKQRSFVQLAGGAYRSWFKVYKGIIGYARCFILGESTCCCNEITKCLISKDDSIAFVNGDHLYDLLRAFCITIFVIIPLSELVFSIINVNTFSIIISIFYFMLLLCFISI